ncbi:vWA domain-containing protein [Roseiflexus castenholzii]|uniref:von Willebrand factor type A n=1 Tax=Roseiflexus castenholzii (strain DSM 13941 / HLO8) TaxID=383372 RepID=A7NLS8_ROSCS|nr:VWA domain-containing protein [Roseiflexus castenholzii]ABU58476.1 von Willebrand factor type A [Roseiflexus castenholzii DSM 13941]
METGVTLTCTWGRAPLVASDAPQVAYLLVEAQASAVAEKAPLNFCLVLDRSGSMQGAKLAALKEATRRVIDTLTPQDIVSIVLFDDTVQTLVPATFATDRDALKAQVDAIEEAGGTAMSGGMAAGIVELRKHHDPGRVSAMLLLTDGQTWGDEDRCRALAQELARDHVRVTALGLGAEWNEKLLDDIADATGGLSDYIADPSQITTFFQHAVRMAQGTIAQDARLLLRLVRGATPRAVYRANPIIANLGYQPIGDSEIAVRLGAIETDAPSSVIVDMMVPAREAGVFRVAQAELHYTPVGGSEQVIKQDILLEFVAEPAKAAYDSRVMNLVEKVTAFKLQTRALAEAEAGNVSGATQKLRAAATRLLDLGELELAQKVAEQAEQLDQGQAMSAERQKELRYATRRLTQKLEE